MSPRAGLRRAAVVALSWLSIASIAVAAEGDRDRSFDGDGVAELPRDDTQLFAGAVQRDGKLVAVGEQGRRAGAVRLLVARFNRDGSLDGGFNAGGIGLPLPGMEGGIRTGPVGTIATAVAVQRDGKIVVAGAETDPSGTAPRAMLVTRLNSNGSLDRSFGGDGTVSLLGGRAEARAIALHRGKILVGGSAVRGGASGGFPLTALARLNANGSLDRGFGSRGTRLLDFGRFSVANAVAVRGDGRIVLAGSARDNLQATSLLAARLTAHGARDRSFSGDGLLLRQLARDAAYSSAFDLALVRRGKVVLAGVATSAAAGSTALALRLRRNGGLDRSFGGDGITYLRATKDEDTFTRQEPYPGAYGLVRERGQIVLGGYFDDRGLKRLALWALKGNGRPDRAFGAGGRTISAIGGRGLELRGLVRSRGRIYGVGDASNPVDPPTGLAARYAG